MLPFFKKWLRDDSGAVTVDWVILTAFVVGLAVVAYVSVNENTMTLAEATAAALPTEVD